MNQKAQIKPYPKFFKYLPISDKGFNTLFLKTIYLSESIYADIQSSHPKPLSMAILKHQEVHARNASLLKVLKFLLFRDFRIREEKEAYTEMFHYLKQRKQAFDLDNVARQFSGLRYIWMTSYKEGKELITNIWNEA